MSAFALAQLRHAYQQLAAGVVADQQEFARGLLGPAIEELEKTQAALLQLTSRLSEAEELRAGIELVIDGDDPGHVMAANLRTLLDRVDARDSVAHQQTMNKLIDERDVALARSSDRERLKSENAGMRGVLEGFTSAVDALLRHVETRNKGGQQVPFHGDFAEAQPSTVGRLRWWQARMKEALRGESQIPSREQQLQQALDAACLCAACKARYEQVTGEPHRKADIESMHRQLAAFAECLRQRDVLHAALRGLKSYLGAAGQDAKHEWMNARIDAAMGEVK